MCYKEIAVILLLSVSVAFVGSFISYPPYAKLAGATVFVAGLALLALRKQDIKSVSEEGLEGYSGKGAEPAGEDVVKGKPKRQKGYRKKARKSKAKRK